MVGGFKKRFMTIQQLKELGFKREWLSDGSGYWMQLNINSFINGCHITVEDSIYTIWGIDIDNKLHSYLTKGIATPEILKDLINRLAI
jgi:hypothetical protein